MTCCCFCVVLAALFFTNSLSNADKCLKDLPEVIPKRYMILEGYSYQAKTLPITLDVSQRVTHQITSNIFKIFLEEELGYKDVILKENKTNFIHHEEVFRSLSGGVGRHDSPPEAILNTEVWVSPEGDLVYWYDEHRIKECGPIGPPGRFGWFIPNVLLKNKLYEAYWKTFTSPVVEKFAFDQSEMDYLQKYSKDQDSSYYCEEEYCVNGIYTPSICQNQTCAMLLSGYFDSTEFVVKHIQKLQLLVRVIWVGPHLADVVSNLTARLTNTPRSLVFLSFTPSALVLPNDPAFSSITFPFCEEFASETGCKYDLHTLIKLYATMFETGASPAYEAYKRISFNQDEYKQMLEMYRSAFSVSRNKSEAVRHAACDWLKKNSDIWNLWKVKQENKTTLYIGGIFPINAGRKVASYDVASIVIAAQEAQEAVNLNDSVLRDYRLEVQVDDGRCEADFVLKSFIDQIFQQRYNQLVGILGPACSNTLEPLAGVSYHYRTVVVSYSAEGSSFSDRKKYPYFFRTIGENKQYQQVYLQLLSKLNWRRLAALTEDGQKYTEYLTHLQDLLSSHNFTFVTNRKFPAQRDKHAMRNYLEEMKSKSVRIIIGDVYDDAARDMMCQAYKLQMTALQSYVWFLPGWLAPNWYDTDFYNQDSIAAEAVPCTTQEMVEAINGHLSLSHAAWAPDSSIMETNQTVKHWKEQFKVHYQNKSMSMSSYAGYAYDAVWMFALALEQLSKEDPSALSNIHSPETTKQFVKILEKTDFNGVSGRIQFRGNTRTSVVEVRQWIDNLTYIIGIFEPNVSISNNDPLAGILYLNESKIIWLNPEKTKPKDGTIHCFLGLADYFGIEDCNLFLAISNIIGFCILGTVLIIGFFVVKSRYDKKFKLTQEIMNSIGLDLLNVGSLEKWEIPRDKVVINRKLGEGAFGKVYGGEAYFDSKGWVAVAVKTLKVGSTPEEKLEFLCEAEVMKRFDHPNIIKLLGVCTKNEPVYTVMEFMLYGDMKTFLLARRHLVNEKLGEDADEVSSKKLTAMALDVARALSYLAEQKFVHRDVASRNCMVNAARVVKLGDFGMTRTMFDKDYYRFSRKGMLPVRWMSPESLALGLFTPASDVWSFGVLLYEIITFGSFPFQGMGNHQVLEHVKAGNTLTIPSKVKPQAEALIRSCWTLDYKKRPKASEIVEFIANNPRLLHPCLDVPLASVQIDDSGNVDILQPERVRKFSFSLRNRNGSGVFNSPSPWSNGVGPPQIWSQEDDVESNSPSQLSPVGEEDLPEWDMPLLDSPEKYVVVPNKYSQFDATPENSLL